MIPDQNPQVDPAALAETKVLPRYRDLAPGEIIQATDECFDHGEGPWSKVNPWSVGKEWNDSDFHRMRRPIDPVPHTAPKAPSGADPKAPATDLELIASFESAKENTFPPLPGDSLVALDAARAALAERLAQLSTLTDALSRAREAIKAAFAEGVEFGVNQGIEVQRGTPHTGQPYDPDSVESMWDKSASKDAVKDLESPALVQALKGGEA